MTGALAAAQRTADTAGPDALVLSAAGLLAWAVWAWGAVGLALTAAAALPGLLGGTARLLLQAVLPAGARRSAALALGVGLSVAAPLAGTAVGLPHARASAAAAESVVPDWPAHAASSAATVPDWPHREPSSSAVPDWPAGRHRRARRRARRLPLAHRRRPAPRSARPAARRRRGRREPCRPGGRANADVIGPDPDLLLPGQVLRPPEPP